MKAQFVNLQAAADFMGPGAIEIDRYQTEITDIVRRRGVFGQRIKNVPATGHPSRFFEETAIPSPTAANAFVDPRSIVPTLVAPTRVERSVPLKCLVSQINYNLFDLEVGAQQSQFAYLQAKDLADAVEGLMRTHDVALWNGNDTSMSSPTTTQYYGASQQINDGGNLLTIHTTDSIVDGLKSTVAQMVSNSSFEVRPTAIYANLKAFLVNRVGDFGFLLGIALILAHFGSLDYGIVFAKATSNPIDITLICVLLFVGAMGKSAQFPLHVWLPDSMEGPTPISAPGGTRPTT